MPSTILAHQSIVLPLKNKYPKKFDGTALCVGSFVPDFPFFIRIIGDQDYLFHSIGGLLYTVPLSLFSVILLSRVLLPIIAYVSSEGRFGMLSRLLAFFGFDDYGIVKKKRLSLRWLIKATFSVLIGIFSHFLLDLPTHGCVPYLMPFFHWSMPNWFLIEYYRFQFPFFGVFHVTNYNILWISFSIVFSIITLYILRYMKKNRLLSKWYS